MSKPNYKNFEKSNLSVLASLISMPKTAYKKSAFNVRGNFTPEQCTHVACRCVSFQGSGLTCTRKGCGHHIDEHCRID
jgi:hypothetical protein